MKTKKPIHKENKNLKAVVSSSNHLTFDNKYFQKDIFVIVIKVGIIRNQIILKNNVIHKPPGFQFNEKNKIHNKNKCIKK